MKSGASRSCSMSSGCKRWQKTAACISRPKKRSPHNKLVAICLGTDLHITGFIPLKPTAEIPGFFLGTRSRGNGMNLPGLRPSRNDESHRQLNSHSMRAYCPGEATRRNERANGQKTRSTSRRAGAQEAVVYLWCRENPLYLAANQPLNNHKNDHAAAIHAAAARDDCMDGAVLLPDCTGTKEEKIIKENRS